MTILCFLNQNSGAIQGIATIVLVGITFYYAIQTKETVREMKETRMDEFLPILEIKINASANVNTLNIEISNVGKGLARSPEIYIPKITSPIKLSDMVSRAFKTESIEIPASEIITSSESDRKITVKYLDVFSRTISSEAILIEETGHGDDGRRGYLTVNNWKLMLPSDN